ncbi:MAG: hypothetical protein ACU0AT_09855 [Tranquillimonas sp.]
MSDVLARIRPSLPRRVLGAALLASLGALLVWLAFATAPAPGWRAVLLIVGAGSLWLSVRLWQATARGLVLTGAGLTEEDGRPVAPLDQIAGIERGTFAFKPSNGFLLRLHDTAPRAWAPGLWWRIGRRVGVGGVTSSNEAKFAAEMLSSLLAERDGAARG